MGYCVCMDTLCVYGCPINLIPMAFLDLRCHYGVSWVNEVTRCDVMCNGDVI